MILADLFPLLREFLLSLQFLLLLQTMFGFRSELKRPLCPVGIAAMVTPLPPFAIEKTRASVRSAKFPTSSVERTVVCGGPELRNMKKTQRVGQIRKEPP